MASLSQLSKQLLQVEKEINLRQREIDLKLERLGSEIPASIASAVSGAIPNDGTHFEFGDANNLLKILDGSGVECARMDLDSQWWTLGQSLPASLPEKVTNGSFDTDTDWTKDSGGWQISGGTANYDDGGVPAYKRIYQNPGVTVGETYLLEFDLVVTTGVLNAVTIGNPGATPNVFWSNISSSGHYSKSITIATYSDYNLYFRAAGFGSGFVGSIDNVTLVQTSGNTRFSKLGINLATPSTEPHSNLEVQGSVAFKLQTLDADFTFDATHGNVILDGTSNTVSATLEDPTTCSGRLHVIVCGDATNTVTIVGTIYTDLSTSSTDPTMSTGDRWTLQSDGTKWWRIA